MSRPVVPPIYQSTTFQLTDDAYTDIVERGGLDATWYTRFSNPTVTAAADWIARLESGERGLMTASGMGAIATTIVSLCRAGDRIVAAEEIYGDTHDLFVRDLPQLGIAVDFVPVGDLEQWSARIAEAQPRLVYAETLSNPQLRMLDVRAVAKLAHRSGARLVVDNTFASPALVRPLTLGADVVVNSVTKYLNGHSDVVAGAIVTDAETATDIQRRLVTFGACLDPHAAFLIRRGLETFDIRLRRQNETALVLAARLADLDGVTEVVHPSRPTHPQYALAARQCQGNRRGAMVSFVVDGGDDRVGKFMRHLELITEATSLGGVESLISAPYNSSHFSLTAEERAAFGIPDGMARLSVGLEPADALCADIEKALRATDFSGRS